MRDAIDVNDLVGAVEIQKEIRSIKLARKTLLKLSVSRAFFPEKQSAVSLISVGLNNWAAQSQHFQKSFFPDSWFMCVIKVPWKIEDGIKIWIWLLFSLFAKAYFYTCRFAWGVGQGKKIGNVASVESPAMLSVLRVEKIVILSVWFKNGKKNSIFRILDKVKFK